MISVNVHCGEWLESARHRHGKVDRVASMERLREVLWYELTRAGLWVNVDLSVDMAQDLETDVHGCDDWYANRIRHVIDIADVWERDIAVVQ